MKNKIKTILRLLLCALVFSALMSACGGESETDDKGATESENNGTSENGDPAPAATADEPTPEPAASEPEREKGTSFAVNCGGDEADGLLADQVYLFDWGYTDGNATAVEDTISNDLGFPTGLQSVRYGEDFSYIFELQNGDYLITLYYSENWSVNPYDRIFDITVNGKTELEAFATWPEGVEKFTGYKIEIPATVTGELIQIDFRYNEETSDKNSMINVLTVEKK